jgi:hypothetical protein
MLVIANLIIAREMRRQRTGGDPMKVRWWFSRGGTLADVPAAGAGARPHRGPGWLLFQLGRRDSAILGWLVLAALGQLWLVLATSALIALAWFGASVVQLVARPAAPSAPGAAPMS